MFWFALTMRTPRLNLTRIALFSRRGRVADHRPLQDNEGHMIEYSAAWPAEGNALGVLSNSGPGPRLWLTDTNPASREGLGFSSYRGVLKTIALGLI